MACGTAFSSWPSPISTPKAASICTNPGVQLPDQYVTKLPDTRYLATSCSTTVLHHSTISHDSSSTTPNTTLPSGQWSSSPQLISTRINPYILPHLANHLPSSITRNPPCALLFRSVRSIRQFQHESPITYILCAFEHFPQYSRRNGRPFGHRWRLRRYCRCGSSVVLRLNQKGRKACPLKLC